MLLKDSKEIGLTIGFKNPPNSKSCVNARAENLIANVHLKAEKKNLPSAPHGAKLHDAAAQWQAHGPPEGQHGRHGRTLLRTH